MIRAFTLIELMVCISIIAILAAMALPAFDAIRKAAKQPPPATATSEGRINMPSRWSGEIAVLPTGERVLLVSWDTRIAAVLLPPLKPVSAEAKP